MDKQQILKALKNLNEKHDNAKQALAEFEEQYQKLKAALILYF